MANAKYLLEESRHLCTASRELVAAAKAARESAAAACRHAENLLQRNDYRRDRLAAAAAVDPHR